MIDKEDLQTKINDLKPWFHNIHLGGGLETAPNHFLGDFPKFKWEEIKDAIPEDLTGWKILDIGCNAGFYSFELARRGAMVKGIDLDDHYLQQARWVARVLELDDRVSFEQMQVYDLMESDEEYDMIWFMGVFYHLRYPMLALDIVAQKVKKLMVFQTLSLLEKKIFEPEKDYAFDQREVLEEEGWPRMSFIEHSFAGDPTNWWVPNKAAIEAMVRSAGFEITEKPHEETYICARKSDAGVMHGWNSSEFLSATGQRYLKALRDKTLK